MYNKTEYYIERPQPKRRNGSSGRRSYSDLKFSTVRFFRGRIGARLLLIAGCVMCFSLFSPYLTAINAIANNESQSFIKIGEDRKMVQSQYGLSGASDDTYIVTASDSDTIDTGYSEILITDGGVDKVISFSGTTVSQAIAASGIDAPDNDDIVVPALTEKCTPDTHIVITRVSYDEYVSVETIPFITVTIDTPSLPEGEKNITALGSDGEKRVIYQRKWVNGEIDSETVLNETITKEAVSEVVEIGVSKVGADRKATTAASSSTRKKTTASSSNTSVSKKTTAASTTATKEKTSETASKPSSTTSSDTTVTGKTTTTVKSTAATKTTVSSAKEKTTTSSQSTTSSSTATSTAATTTTTTKATTTSTSKSTTTTTTKATTTASSTTSTTTATTTAHTTASTTAADEQEEVPAALETTVTTTTTAAPTTTTTTTTTKAATTTTKSTEAPVSDDPASAEGKDKKESSNDSDKTFVDSSGRTVSYSKVLKGKGTAYTEEPGSLTSTGRAVGIGLVAVDPKVIPYNTKLYIVSADGKYEYGYAIAADTGGALRSGAVIVDLFYNTESECNAFGRRDVIIYVL